MESEKRIMNNKINTATVILAASVLLTACGSGERNKASGAAQAQAKLVGSYYTDEEKTYSDEGIREEALRTVSSDEHSPVYLRVSQAERERLEKENNKKENSEKE